MGALHPKYQNHKSLGLSHPFGGTDIITPACRLGYWTAIARLRRSRMWGKPQKTWRSKRMFVSGRFMAFFSIVSKIHKASGLHHFPMTGSKHSTEQRLIKAVFRRIKKFSSKTGGCLEKMIPSRELTYPLPAGTFEDDCLFPMVGHVSFLEGRYLTSEKIINVSHHICEIL